LSLGSRQSILKGSQLLAGGWSEAKTTGKCGKGIFIPEGLKRFISSGEFKVEKITASPGQKPRTTRNLKTSQISNLKSQI